MSNSIQGAQQQPPPPLSWHDIKETALKNENLLADIRVGDGPVKVFSGVFSGVRALWENIKAYFGDNTALTKEKTLKNLKYSLDQHFNESVKKLFEEISGCSFEKHWENSVKNLFKETEGEIKDSSNIFDTAHESLTLIIQTLDTDLAADSSTSTSEAIQKAHLAAEETLVLLRNQFATPDLTPQIIRFTNSKGEEKYSLIRPAPPIENMVLSGGGAKGFSNQEVVTLLEKHDILRGVKNIAGSSVGAISAALLAGGLDAATFAEKSNVSSSDIFSKLPESVSDDLTFTGKLGSKGQFVPEHVNMALAESIKAYLEAIDIEADTSRLLDTVEQGILKELKKGLECLKLVSNFPITFKHLDILHKINPQKFKNLTITGFNETKQELAYYNASNPECAEMSIAEAVRISMSLPLFFKAIMAEEGKFVDGGISSNLPSEAFVPGYQQRLQQLPAMTKEYKAGGKPLMQQIADYENSDVTPRLPVIDGKLTDSAPFLEKDISAQNDASKTLVLEFDGRGYFQDVVKGNLYKEPSLELSFLSRVTGNKKLQEDRIADRYKLWDAGPNALMVPHGKLTTASFGASASKIKAAQLQAKVRMTEQLSLRQNQATYEVFDSYEDAINSLSHPEQEAVNNKKGFKKFFELFDTAHTEKRLFNDVF